ARIACSIFPPTYLDKLANYFRPSPLQLALNHTFFRNPTLLPRTFSAWDVFCVEPALSFVYQKRVYRVRIPLFNRKVSPVFRIHFRHLITPPSRVNKFRKRNLLLLRLLPHLLDQSRSEEHTSELQSRENL